MRSGSRRVVDPKHIGEIGLSMGDEQPHLPTAREIGFEQWLGGDMDWLGMSERIEALGQAIIFDAPSYHHPYTGDMLVDIERSVSVEA